MFQAESKKPAALQWMFSKLVQPNLMKQELWSGGFLRKWASHVNSPLWVSGDIREHESFLPLQEGDGGEKGRSGGLITVGIRSYRAELGLERCRHSVARVVGPGTMHKAQMGGPELAWNSWMGWDGWGHFRVTLLPSTPDTRSLWPDWVFSRSDYTQSRSNFKRWNGSIFLPSSEWLQSTGCWGAAVHGVTKSQTQLSGWTDWTESEWEVYSFVKFLCRKTKRVILLLEFMTMTLIKRVIQLYLQNRHNESFSLLFLWASK